MIAVAITGCTVTLAVAYYGAMLMRDWALVTASGAPLPETVDAMRAAGQPCTVATGILFAATGVILAGTAAFLTLSRRYDMPL